MKNEAQQEIQDAYGGEADVLERLKQLVHELGASAQLPTERELARRLGASRPSVREALQTLVGMGVLKTRQGSGTWVAASGQGVLKTPFEFLLLLDQPTLLELHEARELIEPFLAERAAMYRAPDDLVALSRELEEMRASWDDLARYSAADARFHQALAAAAQHPVLQRMMACLHDGILASIQATSSATWEAPVSFKAHEDIFRAVATCDPIAARNAILAHMALGRYDLLRLESQPALPGSGELSLSNPSLLL